MEECRRDNEEEYNLDHMTDEDLDYLADEINGLMEFIEGSDSI